MTDQQVQDAPQPLPGLPPGEDAMTLLHRVVAYGDHMDSLRHMANLMGLKVLEEG